MNTVFLVRHGENPANITKEFSYKHIDYPLNPKGVLQAQQTARYFQDQRIDAIFSSPLQRASGTADIIGQALQLPVTIVEEFREINVGELELQPISKAQWDRHNAVIDAWLQGKLDTSFPGGENYLQLEARMQRGLRRALQGRTQQRIIVVGHGGIFTATIFALCPDADRETIFRKDNHNCSISELAFPEQTDVATLRRWAEIGHLTGEAANVVQADLK